MEFIEPDLPNNGIDGDAVSHALGTPEALALAPDGTSDVAAQKV